MTSISQEPLSKSAKFVAASFALIGLIRLAHFILSGHILPDVLAGIGFMLMAFGVMKNGFVTEERNMGGRYASLAGAVLLIASVIVPAGG
jgi:hypothetical protein